MYLGTVPDRHLDVGGEVQDSCFPGRRSDSRVAGLCSKAEKDPWTKGKAGLSPASLSSCGRAGRDCREMSYTTHGRSLLLVAFSSDCVDLHVAEHPPGVRGSALAPSARLLSFHVTLGKLRPEGEKTNKQTQRDSVTYRSRSVGELAFEAACLQPPPPNPGFSAEMHIAT